MGDDFDLFPKRENLDPFSFKTREKKPNQTDKTDDLLSAEEQTPPPPSQGAPDKGPPEEKPAPADSPSSDSFIPLEPPPDTEFQPETGPPVETDGPISDSKTFDEHDDEILPPPVEKEEKQKKGTSPFIVVGGALIIIIGLLYLALTFLKHDKPPVPAVPLPKVGVSAEVQPTAPAPVPEPAVPKVQQSEPEQVVPAEPEQAAPAEPSETTAEMPESAGAGIEEQQASAAAAPEAEKPATVKQVEKKTKTPQTVAAVKTVPENGLYSVQTGAFILKSSVRDLEKKMADLGYDTFQKKGSTTAMMNMLTVGPFSSVENARKAASDLTAAGIATNLVRKAGGGAVINAGSYLLDENAKMIERKIRNLGYPVTSAKKEARLPMTFVRTGQFESMSEAARLRDELKEKGLDAIVVKMQ